MTELPRAAVERLIRNSGAKRVSDGAVDALLEVSEEEAASISSKAIKLAAHAKRKTVTDADIKMACKQ
jgi:histone H3/H4